MKSRVDKAIEYIRSYCDKHACKNCKFKEESEVCMFESCPCDWKTESELRKGEAE